MAQTEMPKTGSITGANGTTYPPYGESAVPEKPRHMLNITVSLPEDDNGAAAIARADRALADEGLNIVGFNSYTY